MGLMFGSLDISTNLADYIYPQVSYFMVILKQTLYKV